MNLNQATLVGRVTRDPELRTLPNGTAVVKFALATNYTYKKDNEKIENVTFHNICCFGRLAETIAQYVHKGQELLVQGRIENRTWEKQDGSKGYASEIMLENFSFGQRAKGDTGERSAATAIAEQAGNEQEIKIEDLPF